MTRKGWKTLNAREYTYEQVKDLADLMNETQANILEMAVSNLHEEYLGEAEPKVPAWERHENEVIEQETENESSQPNFRL